MQRIAITSASGFIGPQVLQTLVSSGYHVKALVLSPDAAKGVEDLGCRADKRDLCRIDSTANHLDGADALLLPRGECIRCGL